MSLRQCLASTSRATATKTRPRLTKSLCLPTLSGISRLCPTGPAPVHVRHASTLPQRSDRFNKLTKSHIGELRKLVGSSSSILSTLDGSATEDDLKTYNNDWMNKYHGKSQVVARPRSTEEVSKIMTWCYENDIAVVPQGGNTGLVGGSNPIHDELIISLSSLNSVRSFDPVSGVLVADAGMVLESADGYLAEKGFIYPLDLGAKGSCQIGGCVATNAGGLRLLRYGSLHGSVLGLEVVLPDGKIWNGLSTLRKDNTGFDLKQLFIGSEGSIGIITGISILCPRRSSSTNVAVFSLSSYEDVQKVFSETKTHLGEILSAFEFFDAASYALVRRMQKHHGEEPKKVFEQEGDFYVLIETSGSNAEHDEEKLTNFVEHLMTSEMVLDGVLAQDTTQAHSLWSLRELITEACTKLGAAFKYDLSTAPGEMYDLVEQMRARLTEKGLLKGDWEGDVGAVVGFGHMGDGNLHLNIVAKQFSEKIQDVIEPFVYEMVKEKGGSISAEHGLGSMKAPYIGYTKSETSIEMMKQIKQMFDPKGLMNPYKYIV
ncbi:hypothetical protein BD324DRAFT_614863 [Kockovaella imperatae]|uniref:FAD-binding PCMH-type domain-containing protein n=1 Tax=Kockovaella imperatae TaxID=4999 RepID=A0A1Y1UQI0_9TREE|nr:hypothetical protein BD324DRAFT_614863 [Kockovaella imperatae]ORX39754.1 hypothetical protein BD324DRAFT_614863 [Kockovaella imperatae]